MSLANSDLIDFAPRRRGKNRASLDLIAAVRTFLAEQNPTTVRGVCYALFTRGVIPSMARQETARVSRLLVDAREDGSIPWEWIVDETRAVERVSSWADPKAFMRTVRRAYRKDFWKQQPVEVEVWSEKGTIRGVLARVLEDLGVGFRVFHGFTSATSIKGVANSDTGKPLHALYIGDYDPSGLCMSKRDLPERLAKYGADHVELERVALLDSDTATLPPFLAASKRKDPRYTWYRQEYGEQCWELDAMPANDLRARVRGEIEALIEPDAWERCRLAEDAEQNSLRAVLDAWDATAQAAAQ